MIDRLLYELHFADRALKILCFGMVFAVFILWLGSYFVGRVELAGAFSSLTNIIREKLLHRYDKAAIFILISSIIAACRVFLKDRRRMR